MRLPLLILALLSLVTAVRAQVFPPKTTPYTRSLLKSTSAAAARTSLGFQSTNTTVLTNIVNVTNTIIYVTNTVTLEPTNVIDEIEVGALYTGLTNAQALATDADGKLHATNIVTTIQTWSGPTNALTVSPFGGTWLYVASGNTGISNIVGAVASYLCYGTLQVSNSTAGNITNFTYANGCVAQGTGSTNALVIPAGKMGLISAQTWGAYRTNFFTILDQ